MSERFNASALHNLQARPAGRASIARIAAMLFAFSAIRLACMTAFGLAPDEAYYWDWSRSIDWGYFDHPPMVAWLAAATTALAKDTVVGIRLVSWICGILAQVAAIVLAMQLGFRTSSIAAMIVAFHAAVISGVGMLLLTPDAPLTFFWALALLLGYRALFAPFKGVWIALGIVCGFGLLSKYTFALFFVSGAVYLATSKPHRRLLIFGRLWLSLLIAALIFLPNALWNASHGWASYLFQMRHGLQGKGWPRIDLFGEYLGGQIGLVTPLLFAAIGIACYRSIKESRGDPRLGFLAAYFCVPLAAFGLSSLNKKVEPNWPAVAYVSGFLLLAWLWEHGGRGLRRYVAASLIVAAVCTGIIIAHAIRPFLPIPARKDPTAQIRGWKEFGGKAGELLAQLDPQRRMLVYAHRYQDAAMLAFYLPGQPRVRALSVGSRRSQYDIAAKRDPPAGRGALLILPLNGRRCAERMSVLDNPQTLDTLTLDRGRGALTSYVAVAGIMRE